MTLLIRGCYAFRQMGLGESMTPLQQKIGSLERWNQAAFSHQSVVPFDDLFDCSSACDRGVCGRGCRTR